MEDSQKLTPDLETLNNSNVPKSPKLPKKSKSPKLSKSKPTNQNPPTQNPPSDVEDSVLVEVENHEAKDFSFASLIAEASKPVDKAPAKKRETAPAGVDDDLPTTISAVLALIVASLAVPEVVRPNGNELSAVSYHLSRILLRHIDISNRLSADALDIIGIISTGAGYYLRVSALIPTEKQTVKEPAKEPEKPAQNPTDAGGMIRDNATSAFLSNSAQKASEAE